MKKIILLVSLVLLLSFVSAQEGNDVCAYYFYSIGCPHCAAAEQHLDNIAEKYPEFKLQKFNSSMEAQLLNQLYEKYGVPVEEQGYVPILFIGDSYYIGDTPIINNTENEIINYREAGTDCPDGAAPTNGGEKEISIMQLAWLAAVDAVNPCELAVLVILLTAILTRFPKQRGKVIKAGLSFSAAIFLMYLGFGLLIISGFQFLVNFVDLGGGWFYTILGAIAILLGVLNIKDAIWYGGGGFLLEVPKSWRPKMIGFLRAAVPEDEKQKNCKGCEVVQKPGVLNFLDHQSLIVGTFIVGLIVSFFLTPCTAGPYFVAGGILSEVSLLTALPYLLVYLLIFISPMIAITLFVYFGFMAVEDVSGWRERNLKTLHWVAGLLLLGLGLAMVFGII